MSKGREIFAFDNFRVIPHERLLLRDGQRVPIQYKAFDILLVLIQAKGRLVEKDELMQQVWTGKIVEETNLTSYISQLRTALGDSKSDPKYIQTVPKSGYRFIAPVRELCNEPDTGASDTVTEEQHSTADRSTVLVSQDTTEAQAKTVSMLNGHFWHIMTACTMYASLYGVALLVETAYQFDSYGWTALKIAPAAFCWILLTSITGLAIGRKRTIQGRSSGLVLTLLVFLCSGLALFGALYQFLPSAPVTQAQFQTHTAQSVYLKEVLYFNILVTLFLIIPFHFISAVERELSKGKQDSVLALLTNSPQSVQPKGTIYIKPHLLGFLLVVITLWALIVRAYVLDQLLPGSYMNLFMGVYYVRLFLFLGLPAYCLAWYFRALNELKRQCLVNKSIADHSTQDGVSISNSNRILYHYPLRTKVMIAIGIIVSASIGLILWSERRTEKATFVPSTVVSQAVEENLIRLTNDSASDVFPSWSYNGELIAFISNRERITRFGDLYTVSPDGTNLRRVTLVPDLEFGIADHPVWLSNSGDLVLSETVGLHEIMRFHLSANPPLPVVRTVINGSSPFFTQLLLVPGGLGSSGFTVTKDGSRAAWVSITTSHRSCPMQAEVRTASLPLLSGQTTISIGTVVVTGTTSCNFQPGTQFPFHRISFSPDGSQLVVSRIQDPNRIGYDLEIYNLDGSFVRKLTTDGTAPTGITNWHPDWSSDNRITFASNRSGRFEVYTIKPDGTDMRQVTFNGGDWPSWSPDSTRIAFQSDRDGNSEIYDIKVR